ncbi:MAG: hypothetical protein NVV62_03830 [Terricaulis sp.]|nr:hypothetical protein [Terricaulis sp.]
MDWSAASGELWASFLQILAALDLDLSTAALIKYLLLVIAVIALLWVIGDVYRGEIQNRDMAIDVISHDRPGYGAADVLFTRRTFDTRAERLPAKIIVEHRFLIAHGDRQLSRRVRVFRRAFKLNAMSKQTTLLRDGQFAFQEDIEKEIKNRAEYLTRVALRKYRGNLSNMIARRFHKDWEEPEAIGATYLARIHFPSNPYFLLFQHPDREVKATGWLTLLTSAFALFAQFLFTSPDRPEAARADPPVVVRSP